MKTTMKKLLNPILIGCLKFNPLCLDDFIKIIEYRLNENYIPIHITGVNPETVVHASNNKIVKEAINNSDLVNIDNNFIVLTLRILGYKIPCRIATPDLFESSTEYGE